MNNPAAAFVPAPFPRHLLSFPKSGRTWLRYALLRLGYGDKDIRFHHDGFEFSDPSLPALDFDAQKRIAAYRSDKVVWLRRDPKDLYVSFHNQITVRFRDIFGLDCPMEELAEHPYFGADKLAGFLRMQERIAAELGWLVLDYSDLHRDFEGCLRLCLRHWGLPEPSGLSLAQAAKESSFDNMRAVEDEGLFPADWLRRRNGAPKTRRGEQGSFRLEASLAAQNILGSIFPDPASLPCPGLCLWLTGLPASGKTTLANMARHRLEQLGFECAAFDGDELRNSPPASHFGFGREGHRMQARHAARLAGLAASDGKIALVSLVSPYRDDREAAGALFPPGRFAEIHCRCPAEACARRDPKGHWKQARSGSLDNFTGAAGPYEEPPAPGLALDTDACSPEECADLIAKLACERMRP